MLLLSVYTVAENRNSSDQHVFKLNVFLLCTYLLGLWKDCTAASFYYSLFMSELLNHNIKRVKYVLTHLRKVYI